MELGDGALGGMPFGLVDGEHDGRPDLRSSSAMSRSCGARPARASTTKTTTSASAIAACACFAISNRMPDRRDRLEAAGVDDEEFAVAGAPAAVVAVARQAREVGDERVARLREPVEQRRLADVGTADERDRGQHQAATAP